MKVSQLVDIIAEFYDALEDENEGWGRELAEDIEEEMGIKFSEVWECAACDMEIE